MKRIKGILTVFILITAVFQNGCDTKKTDNTALLAVALIASSAGQYGSITFTNNGGSVLFAAAPGTSSGTGYNFAAASGNNQVQLVIPQATLSAGVWNNMNSSFIFNYTNMMAYKVRSDLDFTLTVTSIDSNRIKGTFTGGLRCNMGDVTSVQGNFDLAYTN